MRKIASSAGAARATCIGAALILGVLVLAGPATAAALEVQTFPGGRYVTGGVGAAEREEMQALRPAYNLRILTARSKSGDYVADAQVVIRRGKDSVLEMVTTGPLTLVQLPPGAYSVAVTFDGKTQERNVSIGPGDRRELYLYWE